MMIAVHKCPGPVHENLLQYLDSRKKMQNWLKELEKAVAQWMRVEDPEGFLDVSMEINRGGMIVVEATELSPYAYRVYINLMHSDDRPARNLYTVSVDAYDFVPGYCLAYLAEQEEG